jgi:dipeptidase E
MNLLLTSAGLTNSQIADELARLAGRPLTELSLLFVPTAANSEGGDKRWIIDNLNDFKKYNFKSIDILDVAAVDRENWQTRCKGVDVICMGGGNEKYLAEVFEKIGMKEFLGTMRKDQVYMGISAGSMVAGQYISDELYALVYPEEASFGAVSAKPMALYNFCFIPHLNSDFFQHIRKEGLDALKDRFTSDVYSMDDYTAISILENNVNIIGEGNYWVSKK